MRFSIVFFGRRIGGWRGGERGTRFEVGCEELGTNSPPWFPDLRSEALIV
jgi:hypothetical protein